MMNPAPPQIPPSIFPSARQDARVASTPTSTAQTEHSAYALAFQDNEFLLRDDLRPVRFQLELLKAVDYPNPEAVWARVQERQAQKAAQEAAMQAPPPPPGAPPMPPPGAPPPA